MGEGFFSGFPGCRVQSVLCFLKGRTSSFLQSSLFILIQPCLGKIIFSSLYIFDDMCVLKLVLSERLIFLLFLQYYGGSIALNIVFLLVGFFFFLFLFVGGVSCVFYLYYTRLWFRLFWACWVSGSFSGGPGHIFSAWGSAV